MSKFIQEFTRAEWQDYPKDHFNPMIRSWCEKNNYKQYDIHNKEMVYQRIPYRMKKCATCKFDCQPCTCPCHDTVEVAKDFLEMVERRRTVVQTSLKV